MLLIPCSFILGFSAKGVRPSVLFPLNIRNVEVVGSEGFCPSYLPPVEFFGNGEIYEILMVYKDGDLVFGSFQIRSPFPEGFDYGEEFLIINLVVNLRRSQLSGVVRY